MKENRTKVIRARLSEEEKEQVFRRAKAEGVTLSMYLRKSVLGERITSKADIQTVFELKKIGTNLNQLAKHVNSLPVDENIRLSLESIEMYIKELKQITDKLICRRSIKPQNRLSVKED